MVNRAIQILIAIDQLINTFLPNGWADETISARLWRMRDSGRLWRAAMIIVDLLFIVPGHCKRAYEVERNRAQLPPEYRT